MLSRNLVRAPQDQRQMKSLPNVTRYRVGLSGCGQSSVYTVLCQAGSSSCTVVDARQTAILRAPAEAPRSLRSPTFRLDFPRCRRTRRS